MLIPLMTTLSGRGQISPLLNSFSDEALTSYFDPQPVNLIDGTEAFTSDTGQFTKYTETSAGTFTVTGGVGRIVHNSGVNTNRNDIVTVTSSSFTMPCAFVSIEVPTNAVQSSGYDNLGVGLVKDANNFLFASLDRAGSFARIQIKVSGTSTFKGTVTHSWSAPFEFALSLVGNSACIWVKSAGIWTYLTGVDLTEYDFRTAGNLTNWKAGFTLASQNDATWDFDNLKWGRFGGVGIRDMTIATNEDGSVYEDSGSIYFSATLPDPRGAAYAGILKMDMSDLSYEQTGALMVNRSSKVHTDLVPHIIKTSSGSRVVIATWGNGFGGTLQVLYKNEALVDLLNGSHVVSSMTALSLPGSLSGSYGQYDAMLAYDTTNGRWLITYTITSDTSFAGSPFYAALAYSTDLITWTQIGSPDSGHQGYEGTKLCLIAGQYWVTAGGPAGSGNSSRVYDASFTFRGSLDATFAGGSDTQPHAMLFGFGDKNYVLSFDNTRYSVTNANFTWGQPTLQSDTRFM